jgi:uncharacterized protein (UPF0264 family)
MAQLLVSVRSAREAEAALEGGAGLIDVKEPARGSLGRAMDAVITAVLGRVGGRCAVSAAMGELAETPIPFAGTGLAYAKWGLAGCNHRRWREQVASLADGLSHRTPPCRLVAVAYADWCRADCPPPQEVCTFAAELRCGALLLDTWGKDGTTLLEWLPLSEIHGVGRVCKTAGLSLALAGGLGPEQIHRLKMVEPNWFAVRGSVCCGGRRGGAIDPGAVRHLANLIASPFTDARCED